jgi:hypothetical protein
MASSTIDQQDANIEAGLRTLFFEKADQMCSPENREYRSCEVKDGN